MTTKPSLVERPTKFGTSLQTLSGEPLSWADLLAMNEAWHRKGGRGKATQRADRAATRGIVLTEAGRTALSTTKVAANAAHPTKLNRGALS